MEESRLGTIQETVRGRTTRALGRARYAAIGGAIGGGVGGLISRNAASTGAGIGALIGAIVGETRTDVDSLFDELAETVGAARSGETDEQDEDAV
ncbi:hypothetical protein [Halorubrum vacuolatum]|uniref:Uncharacterized protein n=1 Tax=Halorubrum vacuolatum TaxID=63740 RepID=A0A238UN62_HALVU|nr:hypothetical protein [Halorubrum vacuolatum]SNR22943.1 hypothetical protein SAMN06264855_10134 [Halorubrum vacuolatum]